LEAIGRLLKASEAIRFASSNRRQVYGWVERLLVQQAGPKSSCWPLSMERTRPWRACDAAHPGTGSSGLRQVGVCAAGRDLSGSFVQLYNLRKSQRYRERRLNDVNTRPTSASIDKRRKPDPQGQPCHLPLDTCIRAISREAAPGSRTSIGSTTRHFLCTGFVRFAVRALPCGGSTSTGRDAFSSGRVSCKTTLRSDV
jgi:hypothetical protein